MIKTTIPTRALLSREYLTLEIIDRFRILWATDVSWLCGFTDVSYCRKVLQRLMKMGFVQKTRDWFGHGCYYLTADGIREIGKTSREYEVSYTTAHALKCGHVASWLHATQGAEAMDILTDIELKRIQKQDEHRPDLVYHDTAYEIELHHKSLNRLEKNLISNERYARQIWIVPDEKKYIGDNLRKVADSVACDIAVVPWSTIEEQLSLSNPSKNKKEGIKCY